MITQGDPGGPLYKEQNKLWCIIAAMINAAMSLGCTLPEDAAAIRVACTAKKEAEAAKAKADSEAQAKREAEQKRETAALAAVAAKAATLNDPAALEAPLVSEPDRTHRDPIVERLETLHRDDVLANAPGCRPVVEGLRIDPPVNNRPGVSVITISSVPGRPGSVRTRSELRHDRMVFSVGGLMGFGRAKQKSDTWMHGIIHRVKSQHDVGGYETEAITSTGGKYHRLTFLLVY